MMDAIDIPIVGANVTMARMIRAALARYPRWFVRAGQVSEIILSGRPEIREQIAMYEHGTRKLFVWPGVGNLLQKALGHELAHAADDNFGNPHFFTSSAEWIRIHRNQGHFDIPKYRDEPLEYFADMVTKLFLIGAVKLATTNPDETRFITAGVFPVLIKEFA